MRWLDAIIDSVDVSLNKLWVIVKKREALHTAVDRITKKQTRLQDWRTITTTFKDIVNELIQKQDPYICCNGRLTSDPKTSTGWKGGDEERYSMHKEIKIKIGYHTYIRKMDSKIDTINRDKEGHHMMTKGSIQEGKKTEKINAPEIRPLK